MGAIRGARILRYRAIFETTVFGKRGDHAGGRPIQWPEFIDMHGHSRYKSVKSRYKALQVSREHDFTQLIADYSEILEVVPRVMTGAFQKLFIIPL